MFSSFTEAWTWTNQDPYHVGGKWAGEPMELSGIVKPHLNAEPLVRHEAEYIQTYYKDMSRNIYIIYIKYNIYTYIICIYTCMYIIYTCMYIIYTCTYNYIQLHTYVIMCVYIHSYMICIYIVIYICIYKYLHMYTRRHIYYTHNYIRIYIYIVMHMFWL